MDLNTRNKLIEHSLFLFVPQQDKINIINDKEIALNIKIKLIKSLNNKNKRKVFEDIYTTSNTTLTEEELIKIYKSLSFEDKKHAFHYIISEDEIKYLDCYSHKEHKDIIIKKALNTKCRKHIIKNFLTKEELKKIYIDTRMNLYEEEIMYIIKYLDDDYRRKVIINKIGKIKDLLEYQYIKTLSYLPNIEDKLTFLESNNKYNIILDLNQQVELISTTNDQEKIKFLKENDIGVYNAAKILKTLTEEKKLDILINNPDFINKSWYCTSEVYESFSKETAREILQNRTKYNIDKNEIHHLINCLSAEERLEYLSNSDKFELHISQKESILKHLPEEYKMEMLKPNNIYNITLDYNKEAEKEIIISLTKNISLKNMIKLLITSPEEYYQFSTEDIWEMIESRSKIEVLRILKREDQETKIFIEKYKTSLAKCLDNQDKIDIIYNRSKYGIHLEDNRKIKLLKTIKPYRDKDVFEENIFNYFDNPQKLIDKVLYDKKEFSLLCDKLKQQLVEFYIGKTNDPELIELYLNILKYTNKAKDILENFDIFKQTLDKLNINFLDFMQYGINNNKYEWDTILINIIKNNKLEEFNKIKNYFQNNFYLKDNHKKNNIENFLELLNAYNKYELLCKNLTNENKSLTEAERLDIRFLFDSNIKEDITNINDIQTSRKNMIKFYQEVANKEYYGPTIKKSLLQLFFGKDTQTLQKMLENTGGTQELNILKFNNKDNKEFVKLVDHAILMTEFIERIINTNDMFGLKETLKKYTSEENLEQTSKYINYFRKYEEFIRKIYELDAQISLTNISSLDNKFTKTTKAIALSRKYGGKAIDLSESQYVLIGHVKSLRESVENLLSGTSDGNSNFICTSPVSHRGQHYYAYNEYSIVFAYDNIPKDSFICSSIDNLGSNHSLSHNTSEVPEFRRTQKGILETSEAASHKNAEMLLYREGIKPCGIIVPNGTTPSNEAIEYHKKYNLPFIITQSIDTTIENPKIIPSSKTKIDFDEVKVPEISKEFILEPEKQYVRQIAILTDPHALYEPTVACLNDIKAKGITEIYSLGDNIGHGPNPRETLELLKQHNVKSLIGNHELYLLEEENMENFKEHLINTGALERTIDMNNWIKQELTEEQLEEIKQYEDKHEIITPNGNKITLIHSSNEYNPTGKYSEKAKIEDSDMIIEGHKHFASQNDNNYVIRAVGIGQNENDDGKAAYAILTIGYKSCKVETQTVPYNRSNLLHTINESNMPVSAKKLIKSWVGNNKK